MSSKKLKNQELIVTQSNRVVEARYSLTLQEQRIVLLMISMIEPDDDDFKDYVIKVSDFVELIGINNKNIHKEIKEVLINLRERSLLIQKDTGYLITGWISSAEYVDQRGEILLSFDKKLKPYLLALKSNFTQQKLHQVINFKRNSTIRIYTLLKQYEGIGSREFKVDELKKILGLANKYKVWQRFKEVVLLPAQEELSRVDDQGNHLSDIGFEFTPIKDVRTIVGVKFKIIQHQKARKKVNEKPALNNSLNLLTTYGVLLDKAKEIIEKHSDKEIRRCISIFDEFKAQKKLKSKGVGLLIKLIENGAGKKTEKELKEEQKRIEDLRNAEIEKTKILLAKEYAEKSFNAFVNNLNAEEKKILMQNIKTKYATTYAFMDSLEDEGLNSSLAKGYILTMIPNYENDKENYVLSELAKRT